MNLLNKVLINKNSNKTQEDYGKEIIFNNSNYLNFVLK